MLYQKLSPARSVWLLVVVLSIVLLPLVDHDFGPDAGLRFILAFLVASAILSLALDALRRRVGHEPNTLANLLTLSRFVVGNGLAAFVLAGARDRTQSAAVVIWALVLLAATLLDGPIARREGPTRFGAVLDIESDSWLTLWCAAAAVTLGSLPWICLAAPIVRYLHPLLDLRAGRLPSGGGLWWSRATGVAQMTLLVAAFAPFEGAARNAILGVAVWPVSLAQLATMLALLVLRRR